MDKLGVSTNLENSKDQIATSYSMGNVKTDPNYIQHQDSYTPVKYVSKLPTHKQLRGEVATADELPSVTEYYDGSLKLKTTTVYCNQWLTSKEACMNQKQCGWCASSNSCIPGNANGPNVPCLRGTYLYTQPNGFWNPLPTDNVNISRQEIGGAQLTTISPR
jgi:hypothetical protein